jgi:hypothetical protein
MKILICGDSFCVRDSKFLGLHWTEKLLDLSGTIELANLAYGGCSNALIVFQLLQGLQLNPDFVILSFTSHGRYEYDKNVDACPTELTSKSLADYIKQRYTTNKYAENTAVNDLINRWMVTGSSKNFEKLKNYFYIDYCLAMLKSQSIKFCYSLGGFEFQQDYTQLTNSSFIPNTFANYTKFELPLNLWYYQDKDKNAPYFHVSKEDIQTFFANECYRRALEN